MNVIRITFVSIILFGLFYCQETSSAAGGINVKLEIMNVQPPLPLDPYRPFTFSYSIVNRTSTPLLIPDLFEMALEVHQSSGVTVHKRPLRPPPSLAEIQDAASAKVAKPSPLPVSIESGKSYRGTFPSLDAWPPLPGGKLLATLRLPLAEGTLLESQPWPFQVIQLSSSFEQELGHGKASFTDIQIRQKLITLVDPNKTRLVLLSTVYPGFLSVMADVIIPGKPVRTLLLYHWPIHEIPLMFALVDEGEVSIYKVDKEGVLPADRVTLHDRLTLSKGADLIGMVRVGLDERRFGIEDYLVVTARPNKEVVAEYWRRDERAMAWQRAEVGRCPLSTVHAMPKLVGHEDRFEIESNGAATPCVLSLAAELGNYRRKAAQDPSPLKSKVRRR